MYKKILYILLFFAVVGCKTEETVLPDVFVDEIVYINNPSNVKLQSPGGWVYILGGIRGIIIYRVSDTKFKAYERSCPHLSPNDCTYLDVENGIKAICRCDKSEYLLGTGEPLKGSNQGLKVYNTYYDPSTETLQITN